MECLLKIIILIRLLAKTGILIWILREVNTKMEHILHKKNFIWKKMSMKKEVRRELDYRYMAMSPTERDLERVQRAI